MTGDFMVSEDEYTEEYGLGGRTEPEDVKPIRKGRQIFRK
jgi:hypothetical protein